MELFLFLLYFAFFSFFVLMVYHYISLFQNKSEYTRAELVQFADLLPKTLSKITNNDVIGYVVIGISAIFGLFTVYFGGIINESHSHSFVFLSVFFIGVLHLSYPVLKDFGLRFGIESTIGKAINNINSIYFGLGVGLAAAMMATWSNHIQDEAAVPFLWVFPNAIGSMAIVIYKLVSIPKDVLDAETQHHDTTGTEE